MTVRIAAPSAGDLLKAAARRLRAAGVGSARLEAQLLLGHATGWSRSELLAHPERALTENQTSAFDELVARREDAEPIAYLLGEREFYGRSFKVDRRALIPRPETELLVDLGRAAVARWRAAGVAPKVVDVGTGSGVIVISLVAECQLERAIATDVSFDALALARENAQRHGLAESPRFLQCDLLSGLRGPLHVVLANLPYVPNGRLLPRDVRAHEPALAIFGGECGTELIARLLREARPLLAPQAEVAVELDEEDQATPVARLAGELYPRAEVSVCKDGGGYDRVVRIMTVR